MYVSEKYGIPLERLVLADQFSIDLHLTDQELWQGIVLDKGRTDRPIYEVTIDGQERTLGREASDEDSLWRAEADAYRQQYSQRVLDYASQDLGGPSQRLELANDVPRTHRLTRRVIWRVKVLERDQSLLRGGSRFAG